MQEIKLKFGLEDLESTARQFLDYAGDKRGFAFYGEMGAGKTTFITAICKVLETEDLVSSPTFAIINEYSLKNGDPVYHFDFYRIKNATELLDIGFYDYCETGHYCFIEWPEKAEEVIPEDFITVRIQVNKDDTRLLSFML